MAKTVKAISLLAIVKNAFYLTYRNGKLIASVMFLVLFPCNLLRIIIADLNPISVRMDIFSLLPFALHHQTMAMEESERIVEVEFVSLILGWLSMSIEVCLLPWFYVHRMPSRLSDLFLAFPGRLRKVVITSADTEFFSKLVYLGSVTIAALLLGLVSSMHSLSAMVQAVVVLAVVPIGLVIAACIAFACELSLVISSVEDRCYGFNAQRRAVEIIRDRKLQIFILVVLFLLVNRLIWGAASYMTNGWKGSRLHWILIGAFVTIPVELIVHLLKYSVLSVFYLQTRKSEEMAVYKDWWLV